jgi:hypothetical protein
MNIEVVQRFPQIKSVSSHVLCCPDLDLLVATPFDPTRDLRIYSLSTGKKIMEHRFPRYTDILNVYRAGRWLFMRIMKIDGSSRSYTTAFDLQELVLHDWADSLDARSAEAHFYGCSGPYAFFQNSKPPVVWFTFRLADGVMVDRSRSAQGRESVGKSQGSYFGEYYGYGSAEGQRYRTLRAGPDGIPSDEVLGDFPFSGIEMKAYWDGRLLVSVNREDEPADQTCDGDSAAEPDLRCLDLNGNVCYEVRLPLPDLEHVKEPGLRPPANAVLVTTAQGGRVVAFRRWSMPGLKGGVNVDLKQWVAFDRDSGEILWHRDHVRQSNHRDSFVMGSHILSHDLEGIHLTDVDTGETEDFALPNNGCYAGNGYSLSAIRRYYHGDGEPSEPMPYFFLQEDGKPMVMARMVK